MRKLNNKNYGLELLRMILCFWVVLFHCIRKINNNIILNFKRKMFHVPSFFFISFFFLFPVLKRRNASKMIVRLQRLSISYFFWPLITWCFNNILFFNYKKSRFHRFLTLYELLEQWIIGRKFFVQFWFLFNLLFFTIIFFILSISFEMKFFFKISEVLAILSYILQYSKYNYIYFDHFKDCISHSIGHFVESFPIAITAFILYFNDILNKLLPYKYTVIFYCVLGNFFILKYGIFSSIEIYGRTYNYNGLDKNIFSLFSFVGCYLIPFDFFHSKELKTFIEIITKFTQGIYCIHIIIAHYITYYFHLERTFQGCIIIYLVSYFISFIGTKISCNTKMKFLFI